MPPTIFIISLSGIVIIMARGIARSRRTQFTASIQSAADTSPFSQPTDVLRPTQKSVQAIRSRATLVGRWFTQVKEAAGAGSIFIREKAGNVRHRAAHVSALRQKVSATRSGVWHRVKSRLSRKKEEAVFQEPDINALFAPEPSPIITTRVITNVAPTMNHPAAVSAAARTQHQAPTKKMTALQRAEQALNAKDYQHAEDILVDHIVHHTKDTKAYMLLGKIALAKSDWPEAMEIFEQVVTLRPEEPGVQAGLGIAAYKCGRYSKALQTLQRAHEEDPTNLIVLNDLLAIAKKMDNPALQRSIKTKLKALSAAAPADQVSLPS